MRLPPRQERPVTASAAVVAQYRVGLGSAGVWSTPPWAQLVPGRELSPCLVPGIRTLRHDPGRLGNARDARRDARHLAESARRDGGGGAGDRLCNEPRFERPRLRLGADRRLLVGGRAAGIRIRFPGRTTYGWLRAHIAAGLCSGVPGTAPPGNADDPARLQGVGVLGRVRRLRCTGAPTACKAVAQVGAYSHSIVAGGFELMS